MITAKQIESTLWAGLDALQAKKDAEEKGKRGTLRGGNAGCITEAGIIGKCPRKSILRALGVEEPKERSKAIMFKFGEVNETFWETMLGATGVEHSRTDTIKFVLSENGQELITVTGRPDLSIGTTGIELKAVCSTTRAIAAGGKAEPDADHLVQSALYFSKGGYDSYVLGYTSGTEYTIPFYATKDIMLGCPNAKWDWKGKKYEPKKMLPFFSLFDLSFDDTGVLWFKHTDCSEPTKTVITAQGCEDYYRLVARCMRDNTLPPAHVGRNYRGEENTFWNCCDPKYCPFSVPCQKHKDFDAWVQACKDIANNKEQK